MKIFDFIGYKLNFYFILFFIYKIYVYVLDWICYEIIFSICEIYMVVLYIVVLI